MKDYMKKNLEEYADELDVNITKNHKKPTKNDPTNNRKIKPSLNEIYEMKTNNYSDYSTETFEKLE